jgi:LysM repeat protein
MPRSQSNQTARRIALIALALAAVLVAVVFATSSGGGGEDDAAERKKESKITRKGRRALAKGEYEVERGDTLVKIARVTGTTVDELTALNPEIDPQLLRDDEEVKLPPAENSP